MINQLKHLGLSVEWGSRGAVLFRLKVLISFVLVVHSKSLWPAVRATQEGREDLLLALEVLCLRPPQERRTAVFRYCFASSVLLSGLLKNSVGDVGVKAQISNNSRHRA